MVRPRRALDKCQCLTIQGIVNPLDNKFGSLVNRQRQPLEVPQG